MDENSKYTDQWEQPGPPVKLSYQMNQKELREFSFCSVWHMWKRQKRFQIVVRALALLSALFFLVSLWNGGRSPMAGDLFVMCISLFCGLLLFFLGAVIAQRRRLEKQFGGKTTEVMVGNGLLRWLDKDLQEPSGNYVIIYQSESLLIFCKPLSENSGLYLPFPRRAVTEVMDVDAFIRLMGEPVLGAPTPESAPNRSWKPGREFWFCIPEEILPLVYADVDRLLTLYQKRTVRKNVFLLFMMMALTVILNWTSQFSIFTHGALLIAIIGVWYFYVRRVFGDSQINFYRQRLGNGRLSKSMAGNWQIRINPDGYEVVHGNVRKWVSCGERRTVLQTDGAYFLFDENMETCDVFVKSMFQNEGLKQEWERQYRVWGWKERSLDQNRVRRLALSRWCAITVVALAVLASALEPVFSIFYHLYKTPYAVTEQFQTEPEEESYDVPLDAQVRVLRELGFSISDETAAEYRAWMEENGVSRQWIEKTPFLALLTNIGLGQYMEEGSRTYSAEAYWFDFEGMDIANDYIAMLEGIQAMAGSDFQITDMKEDWSQVDWEEGTGVITVTFLYNGSPCLYEAEVNYDWLDGGMIDYVNQVLVREGNEKRVYATGDGGQGAILFYRDSQWAETFTEKTGIPLYAGTEE